MKTNFENPTEGQKELIRYWIDKYYEKSKDYRTLSIHHADFTQKHLSTKPKIEVGKWYKANNPESKFLVFIESFEEPDIENNSVKSYGFSRTGFWMDSELRCPMFLSGHCIEATYKEVAKRLIEEANRLEITEGASIISTSGAVFSNLHGEYVSNITANKLFYGGAVIFDNGKWADIIPEKKLPAPSELEDAIKALDDATEKLKNLLK